MKIVSKISFLLLLAVAAHAIAMEDKPALTLREQWALRGAKALGIGVGSAVGLVGMVGARVGLMVGGLGYSTSAMVKEAEKNPKTLESFAKLARGETLTSDDTSLLKNYEPFIRQGADVGFNLGILADITAGGAIGYKAAGYTANRLLARRHGVSHRIEMVSRYYDIHIDQYRSMLVAAENRKRDDLRAAVAMTYAERFGSNWHVRMVQFFKEYGSDAGRLVRSNQSELNKDEQDFVRMLELGAALNNLYFKTSPSKKKMFDSAEVMYQVLGVL